MKYTVPILAALLLAPLAALLAADKSSNRVTSGTDANRYVTANGSTRYDAVTEIAADSQKMAEFITETEIVKPEDISLAFAEPSKRLHLRACKKADGTLFALLINEDLEKPAAARLALNSGASRQVTDVLTSQQRGQMDSTRTIAVQTQPGGAVLLRLQP